MFQRHAARRSARRTQLAVAAEVCEARQMLTGNVTGSVINGDLVLTGDNANNAVLILQVSPTEFRVLGREGTTINQQAEQQFSNVNDDFRINLRGGDDALVLLGGDVHPLIVPDDLEVDLGSGRDGLGLNNVTVSDDAVLTGGLDADDFRISSTRIQNAQRDSANDGLKMDLGSSNTNEFNRADLRDVDVANQGKLTINDGSGKSTITARNVNIAADLRVDLGSDDNSLEFSNGSVRGNATINTHTGKDSVLLVQSEFIQSVTINTSNGDDNVGLLFSSVAGNATINTGTGNDNIALVEAEVQGNVTIDTGSGDDQVLLLESVIGALLTIRLGSGNDLLRFDNTGARDISVNGGTQEDTLEMLFSRPGDFVVEIQDLLSGQGFEHRTLNGSPR